MSGLQESTQEKVYVYFKHSENFSYRLFREWTLEWTPIVQTLSIHTILWIAIAWFSHARLHVIIESCRKKLLFNVRSYSFFDWACFCKDKYIHLILQARFSVNNIMWPSLQKPGLTVFKQSTWICNIFISSQVANQFTSSLSWRKVHSCIISSR